MPSPTGAAELLGDEMVGLRLIDESEPGMMVVVSSVDIPSELLAQFGRARVGTGVAGRAIVEDRLCVAEGYPDADGTIGAFADNGVHAAMAAPVHLAGRTVGSLAVASAPRGPDLLGGRTQHPDRFRGPCRPGPQRRPHRPSHGQSPRRRRCTRPRTTS